MNTWLALCAALVASAAALQFCFPISLLTQSGEEELPAFWLFPIRDLGREHLKHGLRNVPVKGLNTAPSHNVGIKNGQIAAKGQFPHMVSLYVDFSTFCGGTIVSDRWILSTGQCISGSDISIAYVGAYDMKYPKESGRQALVTRESFVHPSYAFPLNDIALIHLLWDIQMTSYVKAITLPSSTQSSLIGQQLVISGWGRQSEAGSLLGSELRYAEMLVVDVEVCNDYLSVSTKINNITSICVQQENSAETSDGDFGSPLVQKNDDGTYTLFGALSLGSRFPGYPRICTNVASYITWINEIMALT